MQEVQAGTEKGRERDGLTLLDRQTDVQREGNRQHTQTDKKEVDRERKGGTHGKTDRQNEAGGQRSEKPGPQKANGRPKRWSRKWYVG